MRFNRTPLIICGILILLPLIIKLGETVEIIKGFLTGSIYMTPEAFPTYGEWLLIVVTGFFSYLLWQVSRQGLIQQQIQQTQLELFKLADIKYEVDDVSSQVNSILKVLSYEDIFFSAEHQYTVIGEKKINIKDDSMTYLFATFNIKYDDLKLCFDGIEVMQNLIASMANDKNRMPELLYKDMFEGRVKSLIVLINEAKTNLDKTIKEINQVYSKKQIEYKELLKSRT